MARKKRRVNGSGTVYPQEEQRRYQFSVTAGSYFTSEGKGRYLFGEEEEGRGGEAAKAGYDKC